MAEPQEGKKRAWEAAERCSQMASSKRGRSQAVELDGRAADSSRLDSDRHHSGGGVDGTAESAIGRGSAAVRPDPASRACACARPTHWRLGGAM